MQVAAIEDKSFRSFICVSFYHSGGRMVEVGRMVQCQKRPITGLFYSVKRDLLQCQQSR
jgi:hypothetical protein